MYLNMQKNKQLIQEEVAVLFKQQVILECVNDLKAIIQIDCLNIEMSNRSQLRNQVYERLKFWDTKRADLLRHHKKSVQQIQQFLQKRIGDSREYILHIKNYLESRINQLKSYSQNSIMNSDFILEKNKADAYQAHYNLIKDIIGVEAAEIKETEQKRQKLLELYLNFKEFSEAEKQKQESEEDQNNKLDGSSILLARGNIKYLIQCELDDIIQNVIELGDNVSQSFNGKGEKNDLYITMLNFVHQTHRQSAKHREIGRELLNLVSTTMKREIKIQEKIRENLKVWSQIDGPIDQIFLQQMEKKDINSMIKHFYDLNEVANIQFEEPTIEDFLINFHISPFVDHERLKLCEIEGIYNKQIETIIVITADNYVHLLRMNNPKPDFSFFLNSQLQLQKVRQCCVNVTQYKKWMYFKKQKQFEFVLEFLEDNDYLHFKSIVQKISSCKIK